MGASGAITSIDQLMAHIRQLQADVQRGIIEIETSEKDFGVDLKMKRVETQKLLDEISVLIQTADDTKLDETIRELKSIRDVLNASC